MRTSTAKGITSKTTTKVGDEKDKGRSGVAAGDEPNFVLVFVFLVWLVTENERLLVTREKGSSCWGSYEAPGGTYAFLAKLGSALFPYCIRVGTHSARC
uniref:Uncharacterized protein n=1 Tax=Vespula pensylvanica TaxID=30213 RepID=A0A834UCY4_VESPE|nr:hypothetical protein H0235_004688 [Vespula pensylvanica]